MCLFDVTVIFHRRKQSLIYVPLSCPSNISCGSRNLEPVSLSCSSDFSHEKAEPYICGFYLVPVVLHLEVRV